MFSVNENYLNLQGSYLFSTIAKKVKEYSDLHSEQKIIRLGIGDVTQLIAPAIIEAMHKAVDDMGTLAGFTGVRLGYTVVPKDLNRGGVSLHSLWLRRHGTKYNGAPYIIQRAGEAVYSEEGKKQLKKQVSYYMENAGLILKGLKEAGFTAYGGVNAPYIWLKTPDRMSSWEIFDYLLEKAQLVGTPGSGFGPHGEGYFRLTAFGTHMNTLEALERIKKL